MNLNELLATLKTKDIQLAITDGQLRVNGNKQALSEPGLLAALREHKPALIELDDTYRKSNPEIAKKYEQLIKNLK